MSGLDEVRDHFANDRAHAHCTYRADLLAILDRAARAVPTETRGAWLCAKCHRGSEEHALGGPSADCVADMEFVPAETLADRVRALVELRALLDPAEQPAETGAQRYRRTLREMTSSPDVLDVLDRMDAEDAEQPATRKDDA